VPASRFVQNRNGKLIGASGGASLSHSVEKPAGKALPVFDLATDPTGVNIRHVAPLSARDRNTTAPENRGGLSLGSLPRLVDVTPPRRGGWGWECLLLPRAWAQYPTATHRRAVGRSDKAERKRLRRWNQAR